MSITMTNIRTTLRHYEAEKAAQEKRLRKEQREAKVEKLHRKPAKMIEALFRRKIPVKALPSFSDFQKVGEILQNKWTYTRGKREGFSQFLKDIARKEYTSVYEEAKTLRYIFHYAPQWARDPKGWMPKEGVYDTEELVLDLIHYLFAKFPVPKFMNQAWDEINERYIRWFIHLGSGLNIRTAPGLPIELTKRMAHFFTIAPEDYTIQKALRYAQIMGMGGTEALVDDLDVTSVARMLEHKDFWSTVLQFFTKNKGTDSEEMDPEKMNKIVEYIYHQKFLPRRTRNRDGKWKMLPPPKPQLSIKGRTVDSLNKSVEKWQEELDRERELLNKLGEDEFIQWRAVPIRDFTHITQRGGRLETYSITQLVSNFELKEEGKAMNHCVATYVEECIGGESSIFMMTLKSKQHHKPKRLVTIEVGLTEHMVLQIKAKNNEPPSREILDIIDIWMDAEQLTLDDDY
ncbi:MAG TPA: hypothetical protein DCS93_03570 [Microscillaceae bacterium]|nr:hypothetical protein [Microscillaceae bacterium]